jgi:hypothetical protein
LGCGEVDRDGPRRQPHRGLEGDATRRSAASFEVWVNDHTDVLVDAEPGLTIEFWEPRTPAEALAHLEAICRPIVDGLGVVRKLSSSGALKYRLVLGDGEAIEGSMGWLWPAMPWIQLETVDFDAYVDAG